MFFDLHHKDHDCSCGVVINLDQPAEKDSVLVQVLKKQGAIPFVRTNLPQALLKYIFYQLITEKSTAHLKLCSCIKLPLSIPSVHNMQRLINCLFTAMTAVILSTGRL